MKLSFVFIFLLLLPLDGSLPAQRIKPKTKKESPSLNPRQIDFMNRLMDENTRAIVASNLTIAYCQANASHFKVPPMQGRETNVLVETQVIWDAYKIFLKAIIEPPKQEEANKKKAQPPSVQ